MKDIVVFLGLKMFNSDISYLFSHSRNAQDAFVEKQTTIENNQFPKILNIDL